jgi:hypothetical protein
MRKTKSAIAGMFDQGEQVGGYRVRQDQASVAIVETRGFFSSLFCLFFGMAFMFPLVFCTVTFLKGGFVVDPDSFAEHHPIWSWLIITTFLCIPFLFAFIGASFAFSRNYIEATNDKISTGDKWFSLWPRLKVTPVSEIGSINLYWTHRGRFSGRRVCGVSIILTKANKLVDLVTFDEHSDAFELARAISDKTGLPIQDMANR